MAKSNMSIDTRFEYLRIMRRRYRLADRKGKSQLFNDMEVMTGLGRKHLIAPMNHSDLYRRKHSRERQRVYDDKVAQALTIVADALDWICAERLQPTLRKRSQSD